MAPKERNGSQPRGKRKQPLRYFYLDSNLHKVLSINRAQDLMVAWNYPEGKRVAYVYSDARRRMGKAYTMQQVAAMVNRHRVQIAMYIIDGKIRPPQRIYSLDGNKKPGKWFFSEKDVYDLHDYLLTVHIGRPRKDGQIRPGRTCSRAELRAMLQHETVLYVKNSDGEIVPVWKEIEW